MEMGLREELQQAMDVLGEWQHYGRSRNAHFEDLIMVCSAKESMIEKLKHQVRRPDAQSYALTCVWRSYQVGRSGGVAAT